MLMKKLSNAPNIVDTYVINYCQLYNDIIMLLYVQYNSQLNSNCLFVHKGHLPKIHSKV